MVKKRKNIRKKLLTEPIAARVTGGRLVTEIDNVKTRELMERIKSLANQEKGTIGWKNAKSIFFELNYRRLGLKDQVLIRREEIISKHKGIRPLKEQFAEDKQLQRLIKERNNIKKFLNSL